MSIKTTEGAVRSNIWIRRLSASGLMLSGAALAKGDRATMDAKPMACDNNFRRSGCGYGS